MLLTVTWKLASPAGQALAAVAGAVAVRITGFARAYKHRRDLAMLAGLDDRMLADIGLTRGDLRDATAGPLWEDPTSILAIRAGERRANRPRAAFGLPPAVTAPPLAPDQAFRAPGLDRPARLTL